MESKIWGSQEYECTFWPNGVPWRPVKPCCSLSEINNSQMNKADSSFLSAKLFTRVGQVRILKEERIQGRGGGKISYVFFKKSIFYAFNLKEYLKQNNRPYPSLPLKIRYLANLKLYHPPPLFPCEGALQPHRGQKCCCAKERRIYVGHLVVINQCSQKSLFAENKRLKEK